MKDWTDYTNQIASRAYKAKRSVKSLTTNVKNKVLIELADSLVANTKLIVSENEKDIENAKIKKLSSALTDRLLLNEKRIAGIADSVREIANLQDPIGQVVRGVNLPNGLELVTEKVPIGVLLVIFESRPNVTIDVAALSFKSGNVCILRGGKEAVHSNTILAKIFSDVLANNHLPADAVVFVEETDREVMAPLLKLDKFIDIVVPRGGEGLIKTVVELSSIPVVKHDKGVVNLFIDESADFQNTIDIVINSKVQRPGVCNALENLIIHKKYPYTKEVISALKNSNVELYLDELLAKDYPGNKLATEEIYSEEFLDLRLSCAMVNDLDEAIQFINKYTSGHTEVILSKDYLNIQRFKKEIDSAGIFVNCSSRFHDGGELGLGAEVGISTGKLHVRGPMGLEHLTTTTTYLSGNGHVRV
ncbi:glutamate-5-semialdehyde dehydrogenase [Leptospira sp. GIMC2001]|uniref:glutamate-5-semialdehyde dehydrogenase n=1 Tax=Leptospira sp. GIMC2001 TaxID=1513297 RepID=UPI002349F71B|nr:glutamate-5-semialdehyde dehydrogenase [Leptospira sp. GIMC2001]WCL47966.1 glutamate-5-semialdehyde dehydrogenase [Leptospira sp. GIMC2001]